MEGFSLALLESQSHGVPTISYDIKYGPSELIINDYNGLLVNFNDENQLYEKVRNLLLNPELQKCIPKTVLKRHKIIVKRHYKKMGTAIKFI